MDWRPGAAHGVLAARAALLAAVRRFFAERGVLEVDTPILARTTVTEPAIESVAADSGWLQTSPEYFMKRLLAAGSGPIYQIARCFRAGEHGRLHNPEFLLLEWYRPGMDDAALMSEVDALLGALLPGFPAPRLPFRDLVGGHFGVDPLTATVAELAAAIAGDWRHRGREGDPLALTAGDPGELLDLAYAEAVEARPGAILVTDFPPEQAALARLRDDDRGERVAARFELVVDGVELANGFHELADAAEQRRRFEADRARRRAAGRQVPDADEHLLAALAAGLPDCSGVALGLDRVLLLQLGLGSLDEAMPFSDPRC
ncbi:MAG: EF-P lysine aminoacylase EpmA [Gammaproteobacteria bacterium]|nr:EF-P lysine aminoacylase EpmA [Gammaproteobacteria bacterium]